MQFVPEDTKMRGFWVDFMSIIAMNGEWRMVVQEAISNQILEGYQDHRSTSILV